MRTYPYLQSVGISLALLLTALGLHGRASAQPPAATAFTFRSVVSPHDPTFTQLLGVNDPGRIAGYDGSGQTVNGALRPNKGFTYDAPRTFTSENYPNSVQTQVIGIDNAGDTGGFWIDAKGVNHGFVRFNGSFLPVDDPHGTFNQILGVHAGVAAGAYQDANGMFHAYLYPYNGAANASLPGGFTELPYTHAQATGLAGGRQVVGFTADAAGATHGFLATYTPGRRVGVSVQTIATLAFPTQGVTVTQALGVNDAGEVVGQYTDASGVTHGFIYKNGAYQSVDYAGATPDGQPATATTINGVNNTGEIVGFYVAANGNTIGFTATPSSTTTATPQAVPTLPATVSSAGALTAAQYTFQPVISPHDPTFTQLLGVNDAFTIAGYDGSGQTVNGMLHPNKGFVLTAAARRAPSRFVMENYPGSVQTQVVAIDNAGDTGGFWIDAKGVNHGFIDINGAFILVDDARGAFNQILGLISGRAVGTYQDAGGMFHAYLYTFDSAQPASGQFTELPFTNAQAAGTASGHQVVGFMADANGATHGFLATFTPGRRGGVSVSSTALNVPTQGVTVTQALGVNDAGEVVGSFNDANGTTHGFTYQNGGFQSIDVPGATSTTVNGVNNAGQIVGFYVAANGNTIGFTGIPNAADAVRPRVAPGQTQALSIVASSGSLAQVAINSKAGYPMTAVLYTADTQGHFDAHPLTGKRGVPPGSTSGKATAYLYRFTARPYHGNGCALLTFAIPRGAPAGTVAMPLDLRAPNGRVTTLDGEQAAHFTVTHSNSGARITSSSALAEIAKKACLGQI